jgi:large repetitive protein
VGAGPNTFTYTITNTSGSSNISTIVITLPGTDTNGQNATDSSGNTWTLVSPISSTITASGGGCTVDTNPSDTFSASTSGTNGQITIGCTSLTPHTSASVTFQANNPQSQSDSYLFPATIDGSSTGAGALYLGANEVQVSFSLGLSLSVDPSNPTSGGAHPVPACVPAQCAFSGTTADFGSIANGSSVTGTDIVDASVIYTGATSSGHSWTLSVSSNTNPACTGGTCAGSNEMLADVDSTASGSNTNGCGAITYNQTSLAVVPTATTLLLATGPENNCTKPYDVIQTYKVSIGTESISGVVSTVTYTLIAN